jgi:small subunit ribosomal protein S18
MARNNDRDRGKKPPKDNPRKTKPKVCSFCAEKAVWVDYKDFNLLRRFISERAKIKARRTTGLCVRHQRDVAVAIKTARELALLPYLQRTASDKTRGGGRGPRPPRPDQSEAVLAAVSDDDTLERPDGVPDEIDRAADAPDGVAVSASADVDGEPAAADA